MAIVEMSTLGFTNDTTPVTVVSSPSSGVRRVIRNIQVTNLDSVAATVTLTVFDGVNTYQESVDLNPGFKTCFADEQIWVLDTTSKIVKIHLAGAVTTTQLCWFANFADRS